MVRKTYSISHRNSTTQKKTVYIFHLLLALSHSVNAKGLKEIGTNTQINKSSESLNLERQGQRQSNQIKSQERSWRPKQEGNENSIQLFFKRQTFANWPSVNRFFHLAICSFFPLIWFRFLAQDAYKSKTSQPATYLLTAVTITLSQGKVHRNHTAHRLD